MKYYRRWLLISFKFINHIWTDMSINVHQIDYRMVFIHYNIYKHTRLVLVSAVNVREGYLKIGIIVNQNVVPTQQKYRKDLLWNFGASDKL